MAAGRRIVLKVPRPYLLHQSTYVTSKSLLASSGGASEHFCIAETILISSVIERVGENQMSVLSDSPYGSNLLWIMHHDTRNLQWVDYTKAFCPQKTNGSNQGLEIDIEPTILKRSASHGCRANKRP